MGSTLLKDVFEYGECPESYPKPCGSEGVNTSELKFCCTQAAIPSKIERPEVHDHFWEFAFSIPTALLIFITSCYNRKLSFHPILSDNVNVGIHRITFEIKNNKEKTARGILILIGFIFMTACTIMFTVTFAGNPDSGYLSYMFPILLLLNYFTGFCTLFLL